MNDALEIARTAHPPIGLRPGRLRNFDDAEDWCGSTMAIQYPSLSDALLAIVALNESSPYDFVVGCIYQKDLPGEPSTLGFVGMWFADNRCRPVSVTFLVNIPDRCHDEDLGRELFEAAAGGWWHST